jgi:uncharacterized delta-60 repeat protein
MWPFLSHRSRHSRNSRPASRRQGFRPRLEALEDRCLLSAGALDTTFNPGGSPPGTATVAFSQSASANNALVQPSGKVVLTGTLGNGGGFALAQFNPSGSLDPTFGSGGTVTTSSGNGNVNPHVCNASVLYPTGTSGDEKILVAGWGTGATFILARYNANGSLDTSFGNGGIVGTNFSQLRGLGGEGIVLVPNGTSLPKIVMVGSSGNDSGVELARYNPDGSLDKTFGSKGTAYVAIPGGMDVQALALDPVSGDLIVAGSTAVGAGFPPQQGRLAAFSSNGTLDSSFGTNGLATTSAVGEWHALAAYPAADTAGNAGKIVAVANGEVARYYASGTLDTGWGGTGIVADPAGAYVFGVAIQPDDRVLAGGNNAGQFALVRYNSDGSLDSSFGTGGVVTTLIGASSGGHGVTLQPNGDILLAGSSSPAGGNSVFAVARYLPSEPDIGSFTASPNPVTSGTTTTLTASNITDANPGATITRVAFYIVINGTESLLGYGTNSNGTWTYAFDTTGLAAGSYTLYAQATDSDGVLGDLVALTLTVQ